MSIGIPKKFLFSTAEASIKKPGRKDIALIYSETDCVISGMFTTNKIKAAPVRLDMQKIKKGAGRAIIVNSGNANACTGSKGMDDAEEITETIGNLLKIKKDYIYICSTGVIGAPMPMERIRPKLSELVKKLGKSTLEDVASAIMTTDTFPKITARKIICGKKEVVISAICKGAGMISPNMATMLCFIITDANIERAALDISLKSAVAQSFNRITIDGDMSTNDTVLIMANGSAGNPMIKKNSKDYRLFAEALLDIAFELSKLIVKDAEGSTKLVEIQIINAKSSKNAVRAAFAVANSLLVKTAIYGNDANWGRLMAVLGYSGAEIREEFVDIYLNNLKIAEGGVSMGRDREANEILRDNEIRILIDLNLGSGSARVLTSDLTEDYVRINAEYRT